MTSASDKNKVKSNNIDEAEKMPYGYQELIKTTPSTKLSFSPVLTYSQQDDCDNIDVGWDWHSPKSKPRISKQKSAIQQSPKLFIKRHPSNDQILVFNKLEEKLKTLIDKTASESKPLKKTKDFHDFFDDSMENDLVMCSQQVEDSLETRNIKKSQIEVNCVVSHSNEIKNDSFDCALADIKEEDLVSYREEKQEEAIRKEESPIKCSPEEIEQKRLQAVAKLEAKKLQQIIEQNRLKALKRLELTRKRRLH